MSNSFVIENFYFIESTDEEYDPDYAGLAQVYGSMPPEGVSPYSAFIYIEPNHEYIPHPFIAQNMFGTFEDPGEGEFFTLPVSKFTSQYYNSADETAACKFFIPSSNSEDPVLDLYNYPFTRLPLEGQCINPALGASPHKPQVCRHQQEFSYDSCDGYQATEEMEIGHISETPVVVSRFILKNKYVAGNRSFSTHKEMLKWCEEHGKTFELTYLPEELDDSDFYTGAVKRMAVSYGK